MARIGRLAYRLDLPDSMKGVHNVFHVSLLRKYLRDPEHHVILEPVTIEQDLTIEARPVRILEESERVLRRRTLKYVRVLSTNQTEREATWELESQMRENQRSIRSYSRPVSILVFSYAMLNPYYG